MKCFPVVAHIYSLFCVQISLQFPYRFWDKKIQGADYFGHIPPGLEKRGMFSVFYDLDPQVCFCSCVERFGDKVREANLRWFGHVQMKESECSGQRWCRWR